MSETWYVYLIRCSRGSLYTGITTDVTRRLKEHASGRGAKYLRGRGPLALVYSAAASDHAAALREERRIKRLTKAAKEQLVGP